MHNMGIRFDSPVLDKETKEKEQKLEDKKVVELGAGTGKFSKILSSYWVIFSLIILLNGVGLIIVGKNRNVKE